jgi:hypothetical protein
MKEFVLNSINTGWIAPCPQGIPRSEIGKWALETIGEKRPGDLMFEISEGHLDYHDGEWQITLDNNFNWVFWTWKKEHCMLYTLRWL